MKHALSPIAAIPVALAIALTGAVPASAAPIVVKTGTLSITGGERVFPFGSSASLTVNGTPKQIWNVGKRVDAGVVEQNVNGVWTPVFNTKVSSVSTLLNAVEVAPSAAQVSTWRKSGTAQLRLRLKSDGLSDWIGPTQTLTVPKLVRNLNPNGLYPFSTTSKITYSKHYRTYYFGPSTASTVTLERLNGKTWTRVSSHTVPKDGIVRLQLSTTEAQARMGTTQQYRFRVTHQDFQDWIGPTQSVVFEKKQTSLGYQQLSAVSNPFTKQYRSKTTATVLNADGQTAYLQKWESKKRKWANVASAKVRSSQATATLPNTSAARESVQLRWHIPASSTTTALTGASKVVRLDKAEKYTGYTKTVRSLVKKYCPNAAIDSKNKQKLSGNNYRIGNAQGQDHYFWVANGFKGEELKNLALHECAHLWQYDLAMKKGITWSNLQARVNKVYKTKGNDGIEQSATCMAHAWGAKLFKHMNYTTNCKGARLTAAKNMTQGRLP